LNMAIEHLNMEGNEGLARTEKDITPAPVENYGEKLTLLFKDKSADKYLPWLSKGLGREIKSLNDVTADESVSIIKKMENAKS